MAQATVDDMAHAASVQSTSPNLRVMPAKAGIQGNRFVSRPGPPLSRLSDSHNAHIFRAQAIGRNAQKLAWILGFLIGHAAPIALNSMHRSTHCFDSAF
jgi:hypothetical protein